MSAGWVGADVAGTSIPPDGTYDVLCDWEYWSSRFSSSCACARMRCSLRFARIGVDAFLISVVFGLKYGLNIDLQPQASVLSITFVSK